MNNTVNYTEAVSEIIQSKYTAAPRAFVRTYGCQQNVSDSQKISGILTGLGFQITDSERDADLIIFNTCAVREHAEDRVFGNLGALKPLKEARPELIIALCGCMAQQDRIAERVYRSFPHVNLVFGTHLLHRLAELLYRVYNGKRRVFDISEGDGEIAEGLPIRRDGFRGWLPVMYGCDNFCTYCIVPHVRGRERSRDPEDVINEAKQMIDEGFKDITLLGQNVNSYAPKTGEDCDFADLLREICALPGDFIIRFMTSHPKDCTKKLIDVIAGCEKAAKHIHLPFQSGSDEILKRMNRGYTAAEYISLARYAKEKIPGLTLSSDVIVGFPGETFQDFQETLELIKQVRFISLYTFIYSPRPGTPAAELPDPVTREEKQVWFDELLRNQEIIADGLTSDLVGTAQRALCEGNKEGGTAIFRTGGNLLVNVPAKDDLTGEFREIEITGAHIWSLTGKII